MPTERLKRRRLEADTYLAIERTLKQVKERMEARFTTEGLTDVTPQQAKLLMVLFHNSKGSMRASDLAKSLGVSAVTVARFLKNLEQKGWVERTKSTEDARATSVIASEKAYEALPSFIRVSNLLMDEVFGAFDQEALEEFADNVKQIQAKMKELPPLSKSEH